MTCAHTGLKKPECSCQPCGLELLATYAPQVLADSQAAPQEDRR